MIRILILLHLDAPNPAHSVHINSANIESNFLRIRNYP
jgi:hypothetical protein